MTPALMKNSNEEEYNKRISFTGYLRLPLFMDFWKHEYNEDEWDKIVSCIDTDKEVGRHGKSEDIDHLLKIFGEEDLGELLLANADHFSRYEEVINETVIDEVYIAND